MALLAGFAVAGPFANLSKELSLAKDVQQARKAVEKANIHDDRLSSLFLATGDKDSKRRATAVDSLKEYVGVRSQAESFVIDDSVKGAAQKIKSSPLYRDDRSQSSNWFSKAIENLVHSIEKLFRSSKKPSIDSGSPPVGFLKVLGDLVVYGSWFLLLSLVVAFGYFAIRQFRWKLTLKRKAKALLEEDEPERTLDEWLERADLLESEGKYREAVRCLYLACLLRFDEARIARFDRGQTNWEHLRRIQESPKLPPGIDFEPTTLAFDHVWYGMKSRGKPDVVQFRDWYLQLTNLLMVKAA